MINPTGVHLHGGVIDVVHVHHDVLVQLLHFGRTTVGAVFGALGVFTLLTRFIAIYRVFFGFLLFYNT